jgi:hypothetical protein
MCIPYGVPYAVTFAKVVKLPLLSILAMVVAPYLNKSTPPDSWIVKFVVVKLVTAPPKVMLPADVTVPVKDKPFVEPVPVTEVTVPEPPSDQEVFVPSVRKTLAALPV